MRNFRDTNDVIRTLQLSAPIFFLLSLSLFFFRVGVGWRKCPFLVSVSPCDGQMVLGLSVLPSHLLLVQWKPRAPFSQNRVLQALIGPTWVTRTLLKLPEAR